MKINIYCKYEILKINSDSKIITDKNLHIGDRFIIKGKNDLLFKLALPESEGKIVCSNEKGKIFYIDKNERVIRFKGIKGTIYGFGQDFKKHFEDSEKS